MKQIIISVSGLLIAFGASFALGADKFISEKIYEFENGDAVHISGVTPRTDLIVTNHVDNDNSYYMSLGVDNANYSVDKSSIQLLFRQQGKKQVRHAIIYRLNYETYSGEKGFQIITVRLNGSSAYAKRADKTCMVAGFDSNSFKNIPMSQREKSLRDKATEAVKKSNFNKRACLNYEHEHAYPQDQHRLMDPEEGDSLETSI